MWGKILTNDNLRKRAIILVEQFSLCRCSGETMDHLLINCDYVYACGAMWNLAPLCLMGICGGSKVTILLKMCKSRKYS